MPEAGRCIWMHVVRRLLARLQGATLHTGFVVEVCGSRQALSALRVDRQPGAPAVPGHACEPMGQSTTWSVRAHGNMPRPTARSHRTPWWSVRAHVRGICRLPDYRDKEIVGPPLRPHGAWHAWTHGGAGACRRAMPQRLCSGVAAPRPRHCVWCRLTSPVSTGSISYLSASLKSYHPKHCSCWHAALRYFFFCCGTALLLMHA